MRVPIVDFNLLSLFFNLVVMESESTSMLSTLSSLIKVATSERGTDLTSLLRFQMLR